MDNSSIYNMFWKTCTDRDFKIRSSKSSFIQVIGYSADQHKLVYVYKNTISFMSGWERSHI